jgi:hypothetical protein
LCTIGASITPASQSVISRNLINDFSTDKKPVQAKSIFDEIMPVKKGEPEILPRESRGPPACNISKDILDLV